VDAITRLGSLVLCAAWATSALAQPPGTDFALSGSLKAFVFQRAVAPGDFIHAGVRWQLAAHGAPREAVSYYAALNLESDAVEDSGARVQPVELYLDFNDDRFDVRVGRQFIFWGRTTWVNPTDVLTAWDYPHVASEAEDYRIAPYALRVHRYFAHESMLDMVWVPVFTSSRVGAAAPQSIAGTPVLEQAEQRPEARWNSGEFGVRLSQTVSTYALDWAVSAYRGFEKRPAYAVAPVFDDPAAPSAPSAYTWTPYHPRLEMLGGDFAKALSAFVLKGEFALKRVRDDADGVRLEGVLGANYAASEDLDVGVQYIGRRWLEHAAVPASAAGSFVERRYAQQASLWLNYRVDAGRGAQMTSIYNTTYRDYFTLAFVWWDVATALRAYTGIVAFGGERADTPYARQERNSQVFVETKYIF